jgi:protein-S-isoprenylcysteine O-methyltransferase Ste14
MLPISDNLARVILCIGFLVVAPIGIYHRLRSRTDERLDRRQEGWPILLSLRPLAAAFMVGLLVFLFHPPGMAWAALPLPSWMRWIGVGFGIATSGLLVWTFRSLGHNLTDTVVTRREATLVTSGPYRWVRHPFYLAFAGAVIGTTLVTANGYLAVTGSAAFLAIVKRTSIEESKLVERFGDDYREYRRRTGQFLPRIGYHDREDNSQS